MEETRYQQSFRRLAAEGAGAFVPFVVLGDPDPETSLELLRACAANGADMLELGIAFSDPVADGPAIQAADRRAIAAGASPAVALEVIAAFRAEQPTLPIGLLLYANLVQRQGTERFYRRAARAGVDSILVADLPIDEADDFRAAAAATGIGQVFMATPTMSPLRLRRTMDARCPYVYVVSRAGVTGRDRDLSRAAGPLLRRIRKAGDAPTLLGFGIGRPDQVATALRAGATGAISGSALAEIIGRHVSAGKKFTRGRRAALVEEAGGFVRTMKRATERG